jgi:ribosomal protein L37AE/L43A
MSDLNKIIKGIKGVSKAKLGIDKTPTEIASARLNICRKCPALLKSKTRLGNEKWMCSKCGCNLKLKVQINEEQCPIKKW